MDDQDDAPKTLGPSWEHLSVRNTRSEHQRKVDAFNENQRRRGSRKRWHDFYPEDAANDPAKE